MSDKKTAHTEAELIESFKNEGIDEQYFQKFIAYYKVCFDELYGCYKDYEDDDFDEGDSTQAGAFRCMYRYIKPYLQLIERGHSEAWAHDIAYSANDDLELDAHYAHSDLQNDNPDLARKNLLIHTKSLGGDEHFEKYYMYLFDADSDPRCRIETAENYSKEVKKQLAKGKSALYAHEYANLRMEYDPMFCEYYAFAYEESLSEEGDEEFSRVYAEKYASTLIDLRREYVIALDEDAIDFDIEKVNAYRKAWVYAKENELKDFERFASIYEDVHLNTYFADGGMPNKSKEEIDVMVLKKVLERFNK